MEHSLTPSRGVLSYPDIEGRALLDASPLFFVHKLIKANPNLSIDLLTVENIELTLNRTLVSKQHHFSPFFDAQTQHKEMLRLWHSCPEWAFLQSFFNRKPDGASPPNIVPKTHGVNSSNTLVLETLKFSLPSLSNELFTVERFKVRAFIETLKTNNPTLLKALSIELVEAAVEQYASIRYRSATPGAIGAFKAQLDTPDGVRALNEHSLWLTNICRPKPMSKMVTHMPTTKSVGFNSTSMPNAPQKGASMGVLPGIPMISFMDDVNRARLISQRRSIHVSLPADDDITGPSNPRVTHLHCLGNPEKIELSSQRLRIIPLYSRAIVVEFNTPQQRDIGIRITKTQKFCFGTKILSAHIRLFEDDASTRDTTWFLNQTNKYGAHSVHESLRRFFCLEGQVSGELFFRDPSAPLTQAKVRANKGLPNWLDKLAIESRVPNRTLFDVRIASKCALCTPTSSGASTRKVSSKRRMLPEKSEATRVWKPSAVANPTDITFGRLVQPLKLLVQPKFRPNGKENTKPELQRIPANGDPRRLDTSGRYSPCRSPYEIQSSTSPGSATKRKAAPMQELDGEGSPAKKPKMECPPSDVVIKTENISDEADCFLEAMKRELEILKRRRALLVKAQADLKSNVPSSSGVQAT